MQKINPKNPPGGCSAQPFTHPIMLSTLHSPFMLSTKRTHKHRSCVIGQCTWYSVSIVYAEVQFSINSPWVRDICIYIVYIYIYTLRKVYFQFLSYLMGYDRSDSFPFDILNQIEFHLVQKIEKKTVSVTVNISLNGIYIYIYIRASGRQSSLCKQTHRSPFIVSSFRAKAITTMHGDELYVHWNAFR